MTYTQSGMVIEVSAMFVAMTTLRLPSVGTSKPHATTTCSGAKAAVATIWPTLSAYWASRCSSVHVPGRCTTTSSSSLASCLCSAGSA